MGIRGSKPFTASAKVFAPAVLGSGSRLGAETIILGPTAIGSHCEIGPGVVINECVILNNVRISQGAYLHRCVISDAGVISNCANLHEMAVIVRGSLAGRNPQPGRGGGPPLTEEPPC